MDAGVTAGEGVDQRQVFAMFAQNVDRLKRLLTEVVSRLPEPGEGCVCSGWADGLELPYEVP
jgi:5'-methylthioadenosine phosphorylase